jgi:nucleoside-triphosphatase
MVVMQMEKKLFLTGPAGCGKSALIREVLGDRLAEAGGFVTGLMEDAAGCPIGWSLSPAASAGGVEGFEPELYLDCRVYPPEKHHEVFRQTGVRLLEEAVWYPFALLDELGGYELVIPEFAAALDAFLRTGLPCVGALRSPEDAELLRSLLGLSDRYPKKLEDFLAALRRDPDCRVVELREDNAEQLRALLEAWAERYAC